MASATNKPFHTYENVGYEDQVNCSPFSSSPNLALGSPLTIPPQAITTTATTITTTIATAATTATTTITMATNAIATNPVCNISGTAIHKTSMESPFPDPLNDSKSIPCTPGTTILSATDSTGTTRMLTSRAVPGQNLVTKLITLPSQSPMDSIREWSVSTFKCAKQVINEKRGLCSITNDAQLQADIDLLRENRTKLVNMLRAANQMTNHYSQLLKTQRQLHGLMNEMSIKCFTNNTNYSDSLQSNNNHSKQVGGKQIVANFSSLGNNLSSTTTTSPQHSSTRTGSNDNLEDFIPILNHIKSSSTNLAEDFKKNTLALNATIKNGEKLIAALTFFCSNLSTLVSKTIEDTLTTVKQFESARLEYDAERNSISFGSPSAQTSITYSSDKLELARVRYEQLKEDVQIKMKFLEENTIKVMHKQLLLFNSAFASYSSGNTAALDSTLKQFSIR